jgi:hemoglobin
MRRRGAPRARILAAVAAACVSSVVVGAACAVAGCGPSKPAVDPEPAAEEPAAPAAAPPLPPPAPSLYERLGKKEALDGVVEELLGNVLADKRFAKLFDKVRKDKDRTKQLRARFVAELCVVTGGDDCGYDGKPMREAHKGMNIGEPAWGAFVEDLTIALKTRNVDDALAKELLDKIDGATKADIVSSGKAK